MEKKKSQKERVLDYMRAHDGITTLDAFDLGITRLSARIWDLKHKDGIAIEKVTEKGKTRYGTACTYDRYFLGELA